MNVNVWLAQSCYSFLQGASQPADLVQEAHRQGYNGICISDFDGVYGLVKSYLAAKAIGCGRIFYGAQIRLNLFEQGLPSVSLRNAYNAFCMNSLPVFAQDRISYVATSKQSYSEICKILSLAHQSGKHTHPLSISNIELFPRNTIAIVPQRGTSQLFSPSQKVLFRDWLSEIEQLKNIHGDNLFLALTPPSHPLERNAFENHIAAHLKLNIPLIATDDAFFHNSTHKRLHDALTSIRLNKPMSEIAWACFANTERRIHSAKSLQNFCSQNPIFIKALNNNIEAASRINFSLSELRYQYPSEFIPYGHTSFSWLQKQVEEAILHQYPNVCPLRLLNLVAKELSLVNELSFADYFLTVWDIVRFARKRKILCQGRGSAANSAICFLLGITAVDPMLSDVLFERFISRERGEPPDIDVDFEHERREEVIQYIYERYGRHRAAMVANVITFQTKGAIRAAAKALGLDETQAIQVLYRNKTPNNDDSRASFEECKKLADELLNLPRHLGIHSGGFVITQEPLTNLTPVEPATMEGRSVIQWNKDDIEALGLFKIDVLALGMLTALRKTFATLTHHKVPGTLLPVTLKNIPPNCPKTYKMICQARTTGVFQIESRAQMNILPKIMPREFYDLVVSIGIIRPGPIVSGMVNTYVKRRLGKEQAVYPHPKLKLILQRTLGVPIFQEQIMRIAMAVADFTPGEADELRRAMGAWKINGNMKSFEEKLRTGMKRNNIPNDFAEAIFKQVEGFSQYGFPESHATSFAHLAYASAWLKAHFPAHFLCGLLNSQPMGFYSPHSLLQEAKLSGVNILEPCLFVSKWDSEVNENGSIQLGFSTLKGLREEHVDTFINRRKHLTKQDSVYEMLSCFHAHERIALAMAGCFRAINSSRRDILWKILALSHTLLNDSGIWIFPQKSNAAENWDNVRDDFSTKGYSITNHPMETIKKLCWPFDFDIKKITLSSNLSNVPSGALVSVAGIVVIRQRPPTAKGMVFITLEDELGTTNLVLKPDVFERWKEYILSNDLICCSGIRQSNGSESTILVRAMHPLALAAGPPQQMLELNTPSLQQDSIFGTCPEI